MKIVSRRCRMASKKRSISVWGGPGLEELSKAASEPEVLVINNKGHVQYLPRVIWININPSAILVAIKIKGLQQLKRLLVTREGKSLFSWKVFGEFIVNEGLNEEYFYPRCPIGKVIPFEMVYDPQKRNGELKFNLPE
jgi:hypothetical protein